MLCELGAACALSRCLGCWVALVLVYTGCAQSATGSQTHERGKAGDLGHPAAPYHLGGSGGPSRGRQDLRGAAIVWEGAGQGSSSPGTVGDEGGSESEPSIFDGDMAIDLRDADGDGLYHFGSGCDVCHVFYPPGSNLSAVRGSIATPYSGSRQVLFTARSGPGSFADGDDVYDGICEVCHTTTAYHRNDAGGSHTHNAGTTCTTCHAHTREFLPFAGRSHRVHTRGSPRGLALACDACHNAEASLFNDGNPFSTTTVCDACHSPGGAVDGVDDPLVGARTNWNDGVYQGDALASGKELWCAGCHDLGTSVVDGVAAPAVVGDSTFGFYSTGHGRSGLVDCTHCHDTAREHIDGVARSYSAAADNYQDAFRLLDVAGMRPLYVPRTDWDRDGPYEDPPYYALCFRCHDKYSLLGGPTAPAGPYYAIDFETNFRNDAVVLIDDGLSTDIGAYSIPGANTRNAHATHLAGPPHFYDSDGDGTVDSYGTCVACHNVHGSTYPAMIRDGQLLGPAPGLSFAYVRYDRHDPPQGGCPDPIVMTSVGVTRDTSVGAVVRAGSGPDTNGTCNYCHCGGSATGDPEYIINCYTPDCVDYYRVPVVLPQPQVN